MPRYTRRQLIEGGLGAATIASLAGCNESQEPNSQNSKATDEESTEVATEQARTDAGSSYSVYMEPAGEVTFDSVPETWISYHMMYADMAIALGQIDGFEAISNTFYAENADKIYYDELDDVSIDVDGLVSLTGDSGWDIELLYEIDADVHLMDPETHGDDVEVDEIVSNIGPIIGNYIRTDRSKYSDQRYDLMEAFQKISKVFQEEDRYRAYVDLHEDTLGRVEKRLPDKGDRPSVAVLPIGADPVKGDMIAFKFDDGEGRRHITDLGVSNAFGSMDFEFSGGGNLFVHFDYEGLLEADPDVIVVQYGIYDDPTEFQEGFVAPMKEDPVGQQVSAVANDRIYRGGTGYQGPITYLFNLEATAMQLYPETFGEFPGWGDVPDGRQLFDRDELTDIIHGRI